MVAAGALIWVLLGHGEDDDAGGVHHSPTPTATTSPSTPPTSPAPSSPAPTTTTPVGSPRLRASDFPGDWNFRFGDVALKARYVSSADYATCEPVAGAGLLDHGCQYAVRWTYQAHNGGLKLTMMAFEMGSQSAAKDAASKFRSSDVKLPASALLRSYAHSLTYAQGSTDMLVLTVVTTTKDVPNDVATKYLRYANTDLSSALLFR